MSRLLVIALVACAPATAEPSTTKLEQWLDTWIEARSCLVANTDDTQTGIAMNALLGRPCAASLRALDVEVRDDTANPTWRRMVSLVRSIEADESPKARGPMVDRLDLLAFATATAISHPISLRPRGIALEMLPEAWEAFPNQPGEKRYNGSPVDWVGLDNYSVVEKLGVVRRIEHPRSQILALPSHDVTFSNEAWFATAIGDDQLIVRRPREDEPYAYVVESTHDGGRTWTIEPMFRGGRYNGGYQDPRSGEIYVEALQNDVLYAQTLSAAGPGPWWRTSAPDLPWWTRCISDGAIWLSKGELLVFAKTGALIWLTGWANVPDLACRGATALVLRHDPEVIERCGTKCEQVFAVPSSAKGSLGPPRGVIGVFDDGRWIYAVKFESVVAVWIEGVALPVFWKFRPFSERWPHLKSIAVVGGEPALVIETIPISGGHRDYLVPLPLK